MGLPQATTPPQSAPPTSEKPTSISQLPPEALELATKLFDFARAGDTPALSHHLSYAYHLLLCIQVASSLLTLSPFTTPASARSPDP